VEDFVWTMQVGQSAQGETLTWGDRISGRGDVRDIVGKVWPL